MKLRSITLQSNEIRTKLGGKLIGSDSFSVTGLSTVEHPEAHSVVFYRGTSERKLQDILEQSPPVLVLLAFTPKDVKTHESCLLVVEKPQERFVELVGVFYDTEEVRSGIDPTAIVHPSASLGERVYIGPHVIVEENVRIESDVQILANAHIHRDVHIGSHSMLHSGVRIREESILGSHCIVHSNSVIGSDGFGYLPSPAAGLLKVPQVGNVIIEDHVEIGALTSIDRGTIGETRIGQGTKIDNQVQIAHNVHIGKYCIICAQVGIAGSAIIGDGVVLGGGVGVADHLRINSGIRVGGHSGVLTSLLSPGDYLGMPAIKASLFKRTQVYVQKLCSPRRPDEQKKEEANDH